MNAILLKLIFLHLSKRTGLFVLSRFLMRRGLRILCYHGVALVDENLFRPKLFMRSEWFRRRLAHLAQKNYRVVSLEDALARKVTGQLLKDSVVITIDDGFYSSYRACEWLEKLSFPATIYVTSYYCVKEVPIFRLVIQYILWKTNKTRIALSDIESTWDGHSSLESERERTDLMWKVILWGESLSTEDERVAAYRRVSAALAVDLEPVLPSRCFNLMTAKEIQDLVSRGFDIQLHTHRHRELRHGSQLAKELRDNRAFLEPLVGSTRAHLCYPSGVWSEELWCELIENGICSATTCDPGLNYCETPILGLKRFLDGDNISQIEFEAEMAGYSEILRRTRESIKKRLRKAVTAETRQTGSPERISDD
jgi:peptidoglycan/xylan/chitin deacetylase (PgdA/CDA1 family)